MLKAFAGSSRSTATCWLPDLRGCWSPRPTLFWCLPGGFDSKCQVPASDELFCHYKAKRCKPGWLSAGEWTRDCI